MSKRDKNIKFTPFIIAVDTREQCPFTFSDRIFEHEDKVMVWTKRTTLKTGDYSIIGMEDRMTIERKSLIDLFSTLGQHRERFEREFMRMSEMDFSAVVIEGDFRMILDPNRNDPMFPSKLNPHSVIGTIQSWSIKYGVSWWPCPNRLFAEQMTFGILDKFYRYTILNHRLNRKENHD